MIVSASFPAGIILLYSTSNFFKGLLEDPSDPVKSIPAWFREKDVVGDCVEGFTETQVDDIPLSADAVAPP